MQDTRCSQMQVATNLAQEYYHNPCLMVEAELSVEVYKIISHPCAAMYNANKMNCRSNEDHSQPCRRDISCGASYSLHDNQSTPFAIQVCNISVDLESLSMFERIKLHFVQLLAEPSHGVLLLHAKQSTAK
jgi:hypothetical protein